MASEPERQALQAALGERLEDGFRLFEPEGGHWSWWDYRTAGWETGRGWRIDHIYLDAELRDHAPVIINLAWPPEEEGENYDEDNDSEGF